MANFFAALLPCLHNQSIDMSTNDEFEAGSGKLKTLLQDIKRSKIDLSQITMDTLTNLNPDFYGPARNGTDSEKAFRRKCSNKLQDFKRLRDRSALSWRNALIVNGVTPSARTDQKVAEEAATAAAAAAAAATPAAAPDMTTSTDALTESMEAATLSDRRAAIGARPYTPPRSFTPGRPPIASPFALSLLHDASSVDGYTNMSEMAETQKKGMFYKPNIVEANLEEFERHINGYMINIVPDLPIDTSECRALMVWKSYCAPDIMEPEATIANPDYLSILKTLGNYPYDDRECVLIKSPSVSYGDKYGEGTKVPIEFPNEKCKLAVAASQGNMNESRETTHDLIVMPHGLRLENRVISKDDFLIRVYRSMPDAYDDKEIEDKLIVWHNFWLIAIRGSSRKTMKKKKKTIKEEKAARKNQNTI